MGPFLKTETDVRRTFRPVVLALWCLLIGAGTAAAGKPGKSNLFIRQAGSGRSNVAVQVGDVLNLEIAIEGRGEQLTGAAVYLTFDDTYLELVPAGMQGSTPIPFQKGGWMKGTVYGNETLGDVIGNSDANKIPGFQLYYFENIPGSFSGQRVVIGDGVLARFQLRVIKKPQGQVAAVRVDPGAAGAVGSEVGYFVPGDPGTPYRFASIQNLQITVQGLDLSIQLPDLHLLPGQVDTSLDLDDYVDDANNPDSTITWTASVPVGVSGTPVPDSLQVSVDTTSHVVTVDPRIVEGADTSSFIGIARVTLTGTTRFDESASDEIRILVDTPPAFALSAMPDTVRFLEDRDTTFVVTAIEPDLTDRLVFEPVDPDSLTVVSVSMEAAGTVADTAKQQVGLAGRPDAFGFETLGFRASDRFGLADTAQVVVQVLPVNDPPVFIKPFPDVEIGTLGQGILKLNDYVQDVDDPLPALKFTFSGVDSIAFDVSSGNARMIVTAVPPFMGVRTVDVVVRDTSDATAVQSITVRVNPPENPQPPAVLVPFLKVNVRAGGSPTAVDLDTLVADVDTPVDRLLWTRGPVSLVEVDADALTNRRLQVSADADSVGFRRTRLTVTDPTALFDTLSVRLYSSNGMPVVGGLPDLMIVAGTSDTLDLDGYYFDADHADGDINWRASGQQEITVAIDSVTHRAVFSVPRNVAGVFEDIALTATDPDGKAGTDTMRVTMLSEGSVVLDLSAIGDTLTLFQGQRDTLDLNDFLVVGDSDRIDWTVPSQSSLVLYTQRLSPHELILVGSFPGTDFVTVTAQDRMSGNRGTIIIPVLVKVPEDPTGRVDLDLSVIEKRRTITVAKPDTLSLVTFLKLGNTQRIRWGAKVEDATVLFARLLPGHRLLLVGLQEGNTSVALTATDTASFISDTDTLQVSVIPAGAATGLRLKDVGSVKLSPDQGKTIYFQPLVVSGNLANLEWTASSNPYVTVSINAAEQKAVLRVSTGFVGYAGIVVFQARDRETDEAAESIASIEVVEAEKPIIGNELRISVVVNPVLKNFLDVFVISKRELLRTPLLGVRIGDAKEVKPISVNDVAQQEGVWVGNLVLGDHVTGTVELSAVGVALDTRESLIDTLRLEVKQASVQAIFRLANREVALTLQPGALSAPSTVALILEREMEAGARAKPASDLQALKQASRIYRVYAFSAEIRQAGEISFRFAGTEDVAARTGVYRWDEALRKWDFVGSTFEADRIAGAFPAFGRYGLFVDATAPVPGEPEATEDGTALSIPVDEAGSGVDPESVRLTLNGMPVDAVYASDGARVVWTPEGAFDKGISILRLELTDLAGNRALWERQVDLAELLPVPSQYVLYQNFPNPFNPQTTIRFEVPAEMDVQLTVYNTLGQAVRNLLTGRLAPGRYAVRWDARDNAGRPVGAGTYLYRLEAPGMVSTRKMMLLK